MKVRLFVTPWFVNLFITLSVFSSPSQYFAQVYTEILGRSPEPAEWVANEYAFKEANLNASQLSGIISSFLESSEFNSLGYSNSEKAYLLYRVVFLREPGVAEMQNIATQLSGGVSASSIASNMIMSNEYRNLLDQKINNPFSHGYMDPGPDLRVATQGSGAGNIGGGELQTLLNAAEPGSTVFLKKGALVRIFNQLVIPRGVTLATYDASSENNILRSRRAYASMGRLVRSELFNRPLVKLEPGAKLIGVWVDGRRSQLRANDPTLKNPALSSDERLQFSHNVSVWGAADGSNPTEVSHCKISDSCGWTGLHAVGSNGGLAIGHSRIINNLITSYSASRDLEQLFFTDGISNASSDAIIMNNDIVDSTDVGIVLFNPGMKSGQRSQVVGNTVLFAGVNGWGGITMDHSVKIREYCRGVNPDGVYNCFDMADEEVSSNFEHVLIQNNHIWSSDDHHANVGISMGVHLWGLRMFGYGGQVLQNRLGTQQQPFNTGVGIVVSGIKQPVVLENELNVDLDQSYISCYSTKLLFDPTKTTLQLPGAILQSGFLPGETWGLLRPKSNGYIFGEYNLLALSHQNKEVFAADSTSLRLQSVSAAPKANQGADWVILHTERNFGDGKQYYIVKNRITHKVLEDSNGTASLSHFSGRTKQFWRVEPFDGKNPGLGIRLVNKESGKYLSNQPDENVSLLADPANPSTNWKIRKNETRELDANQSDLFFINPYGELYQAYVHSGRILEDRYVGNLSTDFGVPIIADGGTLSVPLGVSDFNNDGRSDAAFTVLDGSFIVAYQSESGFSNVANLGSMTGKWQWEMNRELLGFVDMGGSLVHDMVVVDDKGNIEVGFINEDGLAEVSSLGTASDIGLPGLNSSIVSSLKPVGAGDFDGDGDKEILIVGNAGGLFRVDVAGGRLAEAVPIGNPIVDFGFGFTSAVTSKMKPVGITDVNGDNVDDVVMVEASGYMLAYIMKNGTYHTAVNLGNPQKSWGWNLNSNSKYSRPVGISYGKGWWGW